MNHPISFFVFLLIVQIKFQAQTLVWDWSKSANGIDQSTGSSIATDAVGNVFVTGAYAGTTVAFGTTTLTNSGNGGMFLVKYDALGNVIWAKTQGGLANAVGYGISTDAGGNVFVTGGFGISSIVFGTFTLTSAGGANDFFIVKYDPNGNVLWAKAAGGTSSDVGRSVSCDPNGNALVTGYFKSPTIIFGTTTLTCAGVNDCFILKYDSNGTLIWANSAGGNNWDQGNAISADLNGNSFVTGYFSSTSIVFGTYTLINTGSNDMFIVKYDPNGAVLWAKSVGGTSSDSGNSISNDSNGNVFVTGNFQSSAIAFESYSLTNTNSPNSKIFVAKYNSSGTEQWAKALGAKNATGICNDSGGNTFVTGYFDAVPLIFGTTTLTSNGSSEIFAIKYDVFGNELSAASAGGSLNDYGYAIAVDGTGNVFVTGEFESLSVMFGTTTLVNANTTNNTPEFFISKLAYCLAAPQAPVDLTPLANKEVCSSLTTTLTVTASGLVNWYSSATGSIAIANGSVFITPSLSPGNYTYYSEAFTCTNSISRTAVTVSVAACLGLAQRDNVDYPVSVYPNPCTEKFIIEGKSLKSARLKISNSLAEIVIQQNLEDTFQSVDVSALPRGIYFLILDSENRQKVYKLIVE